QVLDPENKAMKIRISLNNTDLSLKPQMFARVAVDTKGSQQALCIPFSSILTEDGKNFIVSYYSKDSLKVKQITLLQVAGNKAYISGDLQPGDKLVVKNQLLLYNALNAEF
ncbi:MAG TPA: efflux RND transporter periplasmic adaptor subunit, partial [Chitinophagaceae bacterium]